MILLYVYVHPYTNTRYTMQPINATISMIPIFSSSNSILSNSFIISHSPIIFILNDLTYELDYLPINQIPFHKMDIYSSLPCSCPLKPIFKSNRFTLPLIPIPIVIVVIVFPTPTPKKSKQTK